MNRIKNSRRVQGGKIDVIFSNQADNNFYTFIYFSFFIFILSLITNFSHLFWSSTSLLHIEFTLHCSIKEYQEPHPQNSLSRGFRYKEKEKKTLGAMMEIPTNNIHSVYMPGSFFYPAVYCSDTKGLGLGSGIIKAKT